MKKKRTASFTRTGVREKVQYSVLSSTQPFLPKTIWNLRVKVLDITKKKKKKKKQKQYLDVNRLWTQRPFSVYKIKKKIKTNNDKRCTRRYSEIVSRDNLSLFLFQEVTGSLFCLIFSGKIHFAFLNYTNCQAFLYALRLALICNK